MKRQFDVLRADHRQIEEVAWRMRKSEQRSWRTCFGRCGNP